MFGKILLCVFVASESGEYKMDEPVMSRGGSGRCRPGDLSETDPEPAMASSDSYLDTSTARLGEADRTDGVGLSRATELSC
jgi:hypothetical protein